MADDIVTRLRDQRDEDGYCIVCGDGKWQSHFPTCTQCEAADEIERLRETEQDLRAYLEQDSCEIERLREQVEYRDNVISMLRSEINGMANAQDGWGKVSRLEEDNMLLHKALALAIGELSTHSQYQVWQPEQLMNQFLDEARKNE